MPAEATAPAAPRPGFAPPVADPYESTMAALQGLLGAARDMRPQEDETEEEPEFAPPAFAAAPFAAAPFAPAHENGDDDPFDQLFDDMDAGTPPKGEGPEEGALGDAGKPEEDGWRPVVPAWAFLDGPGSAPGREDDSEDDPEDERPLEKRHNDGRDEEPPGDGVPLPLHLLMRDGPSGPGARADRGGPAEDDRPWRFEPEPRGDPDAVPDTVDDDRDGDGDGDGDDDGDWLHRPVFARRAAPPPRAAEPEQDREQEDREPAHDDDRPMDFPGLDLLSNELPGDADDEPLDRTLARLLALARDDFAPADKAADAADAAEPPEGDDRPTFGRSGPAFGRSGPAYDGDDEEWPDADDEPSVEEIAAFAIRDPDEAAAEPPPAPDEDGGDADGPDDDGPDDFAPRRWESSFPALRDGPDEPAGPGEMESMEQSLAALRGLIEQAAAEPEPDALRARDLPQPELEPDEEPEPAARPPSAKPAASKPALPAKPFIPSKEKRGGGSLDDTLAKLRGLLDLDDDAPPSRR